MSMVTATNFKKRLGLKGDKDLFVLRNVVMSPFPTTGNFVKTLADIFRAIVEEEVEVCNRVSRFPVKYCLCMFSSGFSWL